MADFLRAAALKDLPPGASCEVAVGGRVIALFNVDGVVHALDGVCPHAGGPLGQGQLNGCIVTCPWHGWQFDVTNGQHQLSPSLSHNGFPVKIEADEILVQLPD